MVAGDTCYLSGQLSLDVDGSYVAGTGLEEATRAFGNIAHVLSASGFMLHDMVLVEIAFIDLADLPDVNALFAALFPDGRRRPELCTRPRACRAERGSKVAGTAVRSARARPDGRRE